eukprot:TRINITY_DN7346_c0_g5_i1.p1 TRINITY_DN7346_c0_g5~~TRINITY_DN7346_c0_g5_i1.p1  ORF type:complete len:545 (+),score=104.20 TRINITY_DN7346_c0_g5_i1:540-2174(+)
MMADTEMEVAAIDTNKVLSGLTESEIQAEILRVQRAIHTVNRSLAHVVSLTSSASGQDNPYAAVLVSPLQREFIQRTDSEIMRMSEPDLIQEICNTTALLMYYTSYSVENDSSPLGSFGDRSKLINDDVDNDQLEKSLLYDAAAAAVVAQEESKLMSMKQQIQDWRLYLRELHNQASATSEDRGIYCVCKQTYHTHRPMIQCDSCENWFHLTCVNLLGDELVAVSNYVCPSCKGENVVFDLVKKYSSSNDGLALIDLDGASEQQLAHFVTTMSEYQLVQEIEKAQSALEKVISQFQEVEQKMPMESNTENHYVDSSPEARSRASPSFSAVEQPPPAGLTSPGTRNLDIAKSDLFAVVKSADLPRNLEGLESGEILLQKKLLAEDVVPTETPQVPAAPQPVVNTPFANADDVPQIFIKEMDPDRIVVRIAWRDLPPHVASTRRAGKMIDLCYACSACSFQEGECACCDSCPRLYHPMCLDPPVSSAADLPDQWFCPQCQSRDSPATSNASPSPRPKGKRKAEDSSPLYSSLPPRKRGRPRKKMTV